MSISFASEKNEKNIGLYNKLKSKNISDEVKKSIELDIPRTFPDHPLFLDEDSEIKSSLAQVLYAYANYNPAIGYCQGMSYIAGVLLMHLKEEEAFWILVQMMEKYNLAELFENDCHPKCLVKFCDSFKEKFPDIDNHICFYGGTSSLFAIRWIRTLFSLDLEPTLVFRIWDIFFLEGMNFIIKLVISLFAIKHDKILQLQSGDLLVYIKNLPKKIEKKFDELVEMSIFQSS